MNPKNDVPSSMPTLPAVARKMWDDDRAAQAAGIELIEVRPGYARLRMRVRPEQLNAVQVCHGGNVFMLADTSFAFACNSRNQKTLAAGASIDFVAPAHEGDLLTAEAVELHLGGRSGVYDVRITNQEGRLVALFRGRSAAIRGRYLEAPEGADDATVMTASASPEAEASVAGPAATDPARAFAKSGDESLTATAETAPDGPGQAPAAAPRSLTP